MNKVNNMERPSSLRPVHLILHRRPDAIAAGDRTTIDGCELATVTLSPEQQSEPFSLSFDAAVQRLAELPRMFVEPDGSFVWVSGHGVEPAWQLDGVVNDRADRVVSVEVKGGCPRPQFKQLLRAFEWPETTLLIQIVQAAVFLECVEYFRLDGVRTACQERQVGTSERFQDGLPNQ